MKTLYSPIGDTYNLYADMLKQTHLLIVGATGSGKSVVINGIIHTALFHCPNKNSFVLIDPKRVELSEYKNLPHTLLYASEPYSIVSALETVMNEIENRYRVMQRNNVRNWDRFIALYPNKGYCENLYVIIDELADLMTTNKKQVLPLIQRIAQIGRAANVHIIAATQCPLSTVIPTALKVNFDSRVGLRTRSAQDSRNILGFNGCEELPRYGYGYYMTPELTDLFEFHMYDNAERQRVINHWLDQCHNTVGGNFTDTVKDMAYKFMQFTKFCTQVRSLFG